jgi:hypothetical protein
VAFSELFCEVSGLIGSWRLGFFKMDLDFFGACIWERECELERA